MKLATISAIVSVAILTTALVTSILLGGKQVSTGAVASPDFSSPYISWGDVQNWVGSANLKQATTTVCAIQSPAATSTLVYAGVRIDTASSTATVWDVAKATTAFATTTALASAHAVSANAQDFILASTSPAAADAVVFAPNTYLVVGVRAGITAGDTAATGFVPSGRCQAQWVSSQ